MKFFRNIIFLLSIAFILFSFKEKKVSNLENLYKLRVQVLLKNNIGVGYEYNLNCNKTCNKTKLTYLGIITTKKNKQYKILTSFFVTGYSCRGISRIVVYNLKNQYLGSYYMAMPDNLPDAIIDDCLVYQKENKECASRKGTKISFKYGIPKVFFLNCENHIYFQNQE